jgi:Rha family phage regulatory protein
MATELVEYSKGHYWTTSNLIAEKLGKQHNNVIATIRKLLKNIDKLTAEISAVKNRPEIFKLDKFTSEKGQTYECYKLNKPAFSLLVMQMKGKKALEIQTIFNKAFYDMEAYIVKLQDTSFTAAREQGKQARLEVTDSIKSLVELAKSQHSKNAEFYYATLTKETYKALNFLAKGEKVGSEFRNHLNSFQLAELFIAESLATRVIEKGIEDKLHYKEIYMLAKQKVCEYGKSQQMFKLR